MHLSDIYKFVSLGFKYFNCEECAIFPIAASLVVHATHTLQRLAAIRVRIPLFHASHQRSLLQQSLLI